MDAFFASVEQLDHPEWRGKPVIVGGSPDGRGVVSAASYEARVFGVRSAMPSARAAAICPNAIWAQPHFDRYHEISQAVFTIFRDVTPHVQPVSVDEAFLDVSPTVSRPEDPMDLARSFQTRVDALGVTC
jgi:DNA polymerase-4